VRRVPGSAGVRRRSVSIDPPPPSRNRAGSPPASAFGHADPLPPRRHTRPPDLGHVYPGSAPEVQHGHGRTFDLPVAEVLDRATGPRRAEVDELLALFSEISGEQVRIAGWPYGPIRAVVAWRSP